MFFTSYFKREHIFFKKAIKEKEWGSRGSSWEVVGTSQSETVLSKALRDKEADSDLDFTSRL